ncbi:UNVERIFIED_CONTAM: hypothetical protein ABIE34_004233 [Jeotgalibacillus campisalis]
MNSADTQLALSRMTATVAELEGQPLSRIVTAARREARAIKLTLPESTLNSWARAVHRGLEFRFLLR